MVDTTQTFQWTGINKEGKRVAGTIQVPDSKDVQSELTKMGIEVISFKARSKLSFAPSRKRVKNKHILLFTRYLGTLLSSGLPILQALDVISNDKENASMHAFVIELRKNIAGGKTLAESFSQYPEYFGELYSNLIKAGEKSGALERILTRLAIYLERSETLRRKVKKALIYPIAILTVAFIVSSIMLIFVVPKFKTLFDSFGAKLPLFTRIVIGISDFMQSYWWIILLVIVGIIWGLRRALRKSKNFRLKWDGWVLRIWVVGPILRKGIIARYARTLATTLESGMPITEALRSMENIMGNAVYSQAIVRIGNDVTNGHQLNVAMASTNLFPNMAIQMISVGEIAGSLSTMLTNVADYYEEEVNYAVDNLSSLLEPLIMVVLGVVIGGLVIAMYLPIFKLGSLF